MEYNQCVCAHKVNAFLSLCPILCLFTLTMNANHRKNVCSKCPQSHPAMLTSLHYIFPLAFVYRPFIFIAFYCYLFTRITTTTATQKSNQTKMHTHLKTKRFFICGILPPKKHFIHKNTHQLYICQ